MSVREVAPEMIRPAIIGIHPAVTEPLVGEESPVAVTESGAESVVPAGMV